MAISPKEARARGRAAALAGKGLLSNPYTATRAGDWRRGYESVPEAERGSQLDAETGPPLLTTKSLGKRRNAARMSEGW